MTGLLQGALGGGRALLIGWILPSLINVLIFGLVVAPQLSGFGGLGAEAARGALFGLVVTAVLGLILAALQAPLYRILEGHLGWPQWLLQARRRRQLARKYLLRNRVDAALLTGREPRGDLSEADLAAFRAHPVVSRHIGKDTAKGSIWVALLDERLHRYPVDDRQVAATRLGNAIRRFEEYGHNRYRLDSQVLWHELHTVVPEPARKQIDDARMSVDFFISLLYGHLLVALAATINLLTGAAAHPWLVVVTLVGLPLASCLWYRLAVVATDEWAGAIQAMVNLGRHPLATALGLTVPHGIEEERTMWLLVSDLVGTGYQPNLASLDTFRVTPDKSNASNASTATEPPSANRTPPAPSAVDDEAAANPTGTPKS
jgi:hypothetical protein